MAFHHLSVLADETLEGLAIKPDGTYVDGTLGGAGHASLIAERLSPNGRLIGIDQDPMALRAAAERLAPYKGQTTLIRGNFGDLKSLLGQAGISQVDGILLDIGVSSPQLDEAERGFSYHNEAPLDMRMNPDQATSAKELVNEGDLNELTTIIREYGEERFARRIAQRIIENRPIETTTQLADLIKGAIPAAQRREGPHPARRTFQALRIAVNDELNVLQQALDQALDVLKPGGRLAVITFHSLEDRIVKQHFAHWADPCSCPPDFPICACGQQAKLKLITRRPTVAGPAELEANPRARSAKLRVAERL